jgi:glucokinase
MILAGDIGGTKTFLGLFDRSTDRPRPVVVRTFSTLGYPSLKAILSDFASERAVKDADVETATFGVAGPVTGKTARLTNVAWLVDTRDIASSFDIERVGLLNDLEAMAYSVPVLDGSEVVVLQEGTIAPDGNMALIAAGTGLGEAVLHRVGRQLIPMATEAGHADFAARNEREIDLVRDLIERFGHAEVEHVVSGHGLVNIHRMTHTGPCLANVDLNDPNAPAAISGAGMERRCRGCVDALDMFVEAYGAEAGNLAVRSVAMGGVFVGGGIAPKILPALTDGRFIRAFSDKMAPFSDLLAKIAVKVILKEEAGLLGAAVHARSLT